MIMCPNVFNVSPKTTLLPVWRRDAKGWTPLQACKEITSATDGFCYSAGFVVSRTSGSDSAAGYLLYFAMYNALPCIMCTHILCVLHTELLHLCFVTIIAMSNAHPYFSLKNLGKSAHLHSKER